MRTLLAFAAVLLLPATAAQADEVHRFKVPAHEVITLKLEKRYATDVELYPVAGRQGVFLTPESIYERGPCPGPTDIVDTLGWTFRNGVLLEATQRDCKPGPIKLRASNLRNHANRVRLQIVTPIRQSD